VIPAWLGKAERRLGFVQVPGLAKFLIGMNVAVGLLSFFNPQFPAQLLLDPALLLSGQIWRALTFLFVPYAFDALGLLIWILWLFVFLPQLEWMLGEFGFTLFCLTSALATVAASALYGAALSNTAVYAALFLAYARLNPDAQILLFFFFPLKIKWIGVATWAYLLLSFFMFGPAWRVELLAGLAGYALFFGPEHWRDFRFWIRRARNRGRY